MATLMEKDVLVELTTGTIALMRKDRSQEADKDREIARSFYRNLLFKKNTEIDYKDSLNHILELRKKYEKADEFNTRAN